MHTKLISLIFCLLGPYLCNAQSPTIEQADSLRAYGLMLKRAADYDSALLYYQMALNAYLEMDSLPQVADTYNKIGVVFRNTGDFDLAMENLYKSLAINDSLGLQEGALKNYVNLSSTCAMLHQFENAIEFNLQGQDLAKSLTNNARLTSLHRTLGLIYLQYPDELPYLDSARYYFDLNLLIYSADDYQPGIAGAYQNIGLSWEKKKVYDSALFYYHQSVMLNYELEQFQSLTVLYKNIGNVYWKLDEAREALAYYTDALILARRYNQKNEIQSIAGRVSEFYASLGDFESAYELQAVKFQYWDSIFTARSVERINKLNVEYGVLKTEKELMEAKAVADQQQAALRQKEIQLQGYLITLCVFLLLATILVIFYDQRQKATRKLRERDKDLYDQRFQELLLEQEVKTLNAMMDGQEKERTKLASELHGRVASLLTQVKHAVTDKLGSQNGNGQLLHIIDEALEETRGLSHSLASGILAKFGLLAALKDLKDSIEHNNQIKIFLDHHGLRDELPNNLEIDLYRIVQELISNSIRHGEAQNIWIQLIMDDTVLRFMYEDDGKGFDTKAVGGGIGLRNIHARSQKYGVIPEIDTMPGHGMRATIELTIVTDEEIVTGR